MLDRIQLMCFDHCNQTRRVLNNLFEAPWLSSGEPASRYRVRSRRYPRLLG